MNSADMKLIAAQIFQKLDINTDALERNYYEGVFYSVLTTEEDTSAKIAKLRDFASQVSEESLEYSILCDLIACAEGYLVDLAHEKLDDEKEIK